MQNRRCCRQTGERLSLAFWLYLLFLRGVAAATCRSHPPWGGGPLLAAVALGVGRKLIPQGYSNSYSTATWAVQLRGGYADLKRRRSSGPDSEPDDSLQSATVLSRISRHLDLLEEQGLQQFQGEQREGSGGARFVEVAAGVLLLQGPFNELERIAVEKVGDANKNESQHEEGRPQVNSHSLHSLHPAEQRFLKNRDRTVQTSDASAGPNMGQTRCRTGLSNEQMPLESSDYPLQPGGLGRGAGEPPSTECAAIQNGSRGSEAVVSSDEAVEQRHLSALQASSKRSVSVHLGRRFRCGEEAFRIQQELRLLQQQLQEQGPQEGLIGVYVHPRNIREWVLLLRGPANTPYANELYRLIVRIPKGYPMKPPICFFSTPAPKHPHIYSNGDICLNLLQSDWHPSLSIEKIARAILSMMASAKHKQTPLDDALHFVTPRFKLGGPLLLPRQFNKSARKTGVVHASHVLRTAQVSESDEERQYDASWGVDCVISSLATMTVLKGEDNIGGQGFGRNF